MDPYVVVQSLNHVRLLATPWTAARQASLSTTNSWSLLKLMSTESVMPSNRLVLCHPLFLLPSIFPNIGVFSNDSALRIGWSKYGTLHTYQVCTSCCELWHHSIISQRLWAGVRRSPPRAPPRTRVKAREHGHQEIQSRSNWLSVSDAPKSLYSVHIGLPFTNWVFLWVKELYRRSTKSGTRAQHGIRNSKLLRK